MRSVIASISTADSDGPLPNQPVPRPHHTVVRAHDGLLNVTLTVTFALMSCVRLLITEEQFPRAASIRLYEVVMKLSGRFG